MVTLTDRGRAVLAGEADRFNAASPARWLGGVKLEGPGWRWDPQTKTLAKGARS